MGGKHRSNIKHQTLALAVIPSPSQQDLENLRLHIETLRDDVADLDLDIETLRHELLEFEQHYELRLHQEHKILRRTQSIARHLERLGTFLNAKPPAKQFVQRIQVIEDRRQNEADSHRMEQPFEEVASCAQDTPNNPEEFLSEPEPEPEQEQEQEQKQEPVQDFASQNRKDLLKKAYRSLARKFHPDLARTEALRLQNSQTMQQINRLYRLGSLEELQALALRLEGSSIDVVDLHPNNELEILEQRAAWFLSVKHNLQEEREELEACAVCALYRNVTQAQLQGDDLIAKIQISLHRQIQDSYLAIRSAAQALEITMSNYNRAHAQNPAPTVQKDAALDKIFDPQKNQAMIRHGLQHTQNVAITPKVQQRIDWLVDLARTKPDGLLLILLGYVGEMSPFPFPATESFLAIERRLEVLAQWREAPEPALEQLLAQWDGWVEYGIHRATHRLVHPGLRLRSDELRKAIPHALKTQTIRPMYRDLLSTLGEELGCDACDEQIFALPLLRTQGFDNLRACVCPHCGHNNQAYWMARGDDVQAVLNDTFIDMELIHVFRFRMARACFSLQCVSVEVETQTLKNLKNRIFRHLFERFELKIKSSQIDLFIQDKKIPERTPLAQISPDERLELRIDASAQLNAAQAVETLRHRIRSRFRPA